MIICASICTYRKLLVLMYEDTDGEWVDDDFVTDCLKLADNNNDGVLQVEGNTSYVYNQSITQINGGSLQFACFKLYYWNSVNQERSQ